MAFERLKDAALPHTVSNVVGDLADLFQKEMRLARAELSDKITTKLRAGIWMSAAGVLGLIAGLLVVQAAGLWNSELRRSSALVLSDRCRDCRGYCRSGLL